VNYVGGVSNARAKKKRRQRARAATGPAPPARAAAKAPPGRVAAKDPSAHAAAKETAGRAAAKEPSRRAAAKEPSRPAAAKQPSRIDVRNGIARPKPIWAPFPLTEIGMAAGIIIIGAGFESSNAKVSSIGALVLAVVVGDLCLREHFSGFRSHTLLLAALPVVVAHTIVVLAITDAYSGPISLAVDLALGGALAWFLRGRYRQAHERNRPT
jgi:hypothetical protein